MADRDHAHEREALRTGLGVSALLCVVEIVGGVVTNSLALLSDAAHMFTDVAALALSLFALWIGSRPASETKTYGYYRAEILAAFVNGVVLCVLVGIVLIEAWRRLHEPPEVAGTGMLVIAAVGLAVNVFVARRLHAHQHASLNLRGAYLEVRTRRASAHAVSRILNAWYRERARDFFRLRLAAIAEPLRWVREAPPLRVQAMTRQRGSCSPAGRITLNPALVKSPRDCIDYVILHELCHLAHHNHSVRFYRALGQHMPQWQQVKARLDDLAEVLLLG